LQVRSVKFSPDATLVASAGSDFYIRVIDLKTGSIVFSKGVTFMSLAIFCTRSNCFFLQIWAKS